MKKGKNKVLIACSGGPDSMALLDMCKDKYDVYVAHVNYHKRETANRDENIVKEYCHKQGIPFNKKDFFDDRKSGNFQDKARVFRYNFFAELVKNFNLDCVMVAHHKDDLIETYLLQKNRHGDVSYYGLKNKINIQGVVVRRPLLRYTKEQLEKYCKKNNIEYGIDESNLTNHYSRNKVRHEIVEKLTAKEKNEYVKEIRAKNKEQEQAVKYVKDFIKNKTKVSIEEFNACKDQVRFLRMFIGYNISFKQANELIKEIQRSKNFEILIKDKYLCKEYGYIEVYKKEKNYTYVLDGLKYLKTNYFKLCKKGGNKEGVTIEESDFPITIRNYREGDSILMRYGTKKINRFFIDNKISSKNRKSWPVMLNKNNSVILVPGIGCDKYHYSQNHNIYMVK